MAQADGSLMQTDDIKSINLLATSWLVHVAYAANKLAALHLNGWFASIKQLQRALRVPLKPSTFPRSTCIDLLWVILYAACTTVECSKYSLHHICVCTGSSKFLYLLAAAAIIYNYSNNQQQQRSRSILPRPNTLTLSYPLPCNLPRVVMIELDFVKCCWVNVTTPLQWKSVGSKTTIDFCCIDTKTQTFFGLSSFVSQRKIG